MTVTDTQTPAAEGKGDAPLGGGSPLIAPGSDEWLRLVTASKVSAILGLSPYESPRSLWHKMRGDLPPDDQTAVQARGTFLESGILNWFFADNPHLGRHGGEVTVRHPSLPWAACTPDDLATFPDGEVVPVDAKTAARDAHGQDESRMWGEPGTDQVPLHYVVQAMWVMHLGGWQRFLFVRLGPFLERDEYEVRYDPGLAAEIEERCRAFYESLSDDQAAPELDDTVATYEALRAVSTVGEGDWECPPSIARELCSARDGEAAAAARHRLARSTVLDAMGDARRAVCAGQVIAQKQATKGGKPALYPPRRPVDVAALPTPDAPEENVA